MIDTPDRDNEERDPIAAAFKRYQAAPRDIVPYSHSVEHTVELLRGLAGTTAEVSHYHVTEDGVTKHTARVEICASIIKRSTEK